MATLPYAPGLALFLITLVVLAGGGAVLVRGWLRETDAGFALTAGLLVGPAIWLALLNGYFHLTAAPLGVGLASAVWLALVGATLRASRARFGRPDRRTALAITGQLLLLVGLGTVALANRQFLGYVDETWTLPLAASMLRGNFPPVSPWAPELAATYHYGPSLAAAGLHVLTGLDFVVLFELLSAAAAAAFLLLVGHLLWRLPLGRWALVPVLLLLLGRGAKVFGRVPWIVSAPVPTGLPGPGLRASLGEVYLPAPEPATRILAAGPPQIELLQYPMAIGLGLIVAHYVAREGAGGRQALALGVLLATAGLLETSTMGVFAGGLALLAVLHLRSRLGRISWQVPVVTLLVAAALAVFAGGVVTDTLFRSEAPPGAGSGLFVAPAFTAERLAPLNLRRLPGGLGVLEIAAWPLLALAALAALATRQRLALVLVGAGLAGWLGFRLLDYRFSDDILRLDMFARLFGVLALGFAVAGLRRRPPRRPAAIAWLLVVGLVAWPSAAALAVPTAANLGRGIELGPGLSPSDAGGAKRRSVLAEPVAALPEALRAAAQRLPDGTRVLSGTTSAFATATGLLTPYTTQRAVQYVPVAGPAYLDAMRSLAPVALRRLGVGYVHLGPAGLRALRPAAQELLQDTAKFTLVAGDLQGPVLFAVGDAALAASGAPPEGTYLALEAAVPPGSSIYVSPALVGEPRNRVFYVLRDRRLFGALGVAGHARLQFPITPYRADTPVDFVALPAGSIPLNLGQVRADAVWANAGVRVYRLEADRTAGAEGERSFALSAVSARGGRLRFTLEYRATGEPASFTGTDWLVYPADAAPFYEARIGDVGLDARQWFQGPLEPRAAAAKLVYEYDHAAGVLRLLQGPDAPYEVRRSEPRDTPGPWVLVLAFKSERSITAVMPVAAIEPRGDGSVLFHLFLNEGA